MNEIQQTLIKATTRILRPLVKMLLQNGVSYAAFTDLSKQLYFDVAKVDFAIPGKKQTSSRISTMTGLSRKEVARLDALPPKKEVLDTTAINRAARVISGWVKDKEFHSAKGAPADLPFEGDNSSFTSLVKRYSGDITARTIADELIRVDSIKVNQQGNIHLNSRAYVTSHSDVEKLTILGTDVPNLIETINHNLNYPEKAYLQRKVAYNYIPASESKIINKELTKIAQRNLESMDKVLSKFAINKKSADMNEAYNRIGMGMYYFEEVQS